MKFFINNLFSSILAGILIGVGGTAYLYSSVSFENGKFIGAALFSLGLFVILIYKLNLFTGKVCYVLFEDKKFALNLLTILLGNFIGAAGFGYLMRLVASDDVLALVNTISNTKTSISLLNSFVLAICCGMMIYLAVNIFKEAEHQIAKYIAVVVPIIVFIICGFEHCIANMYYFSISNTWNFNTLLYLLIMILGNTVGGSVIPLLRKAADK